MFSISSFHCGQPSYPSSGVVSQKIVSLGGQHRRICARMFGDVWITLWSFAKAIPYRFPWSFMCCLTWRRNPKARRFQDGKPIAIYRLPQRRATRSRHEYREGITLIEPLQQVPNRVTAGKESIKILINLQPPNILPWPDQSASTTHAA